VKILFSIDTWGLVGGTERLAAAVVPGLLERGHEIEILCRDNQNPDYGKGLDVHELTFLNDDSFSPGQRAQLKDVVHSAAPDVIFQQSNCSLTCLRELVELAPLVRFVHDHPLFCPGLNKFHLDGETCKKALGAECLVRYYTKGGCTCLNRTQYKRGYFAPFKKLFQKYREIGVNKRAAKLLTNSSYMEGELRKAGFGGELTGVVYPFTLSNTDSQPRGPLDKATQAFLDADDRPVIFTPARLTVPDKGIDFLLTAMGMVSSPYKLVIAGTGPAADWLRVKALEDGLGPDRLHWAGWQDSGAMETLLDRAAVVVCPSIWDEPFGLVGLEAMAHSRPTVAFRVGGIPEWLAHEQTGLLVERKDVRAMASAVDQLLGDDDLRTRLGAAGKARLAADFTRAAHLDGLEQALLSAASH
jgi:glycosyltransferase involved in cell wall biosynthesis